MDGMKTTYIPLRKFDRWAFPGIFALPWTKETASNHWKFDYPALCSEHLRAKSHAGAGSHRSMGELRLYQ
jgi:hypothetical protein